MRRAFETDADICVAPERTLLHVAVGYAAVEQDFFQSREVLEGLVRRADVGVGDDFGQGRAAAVQIEISVRGGVIEAFVEALAGILFHVQACDADAFCAAIAGGHVDPAVLGQGLVKLRNLIALGQVGIEVVLAGEDGTLAHLAVDGQRGQRGKLDGLFVEHRQSAGQSQAHRADVGVGGRAELIGATAEGLGGGEQLHVHLEAYDGLVLGHDFRRKSGGGHISYDFIAAWQNSVAVLPLWVRTHIRIESFDGPMLSNISSRGVNHIGLCVPQLLAAISRGVDGKDQD